MFDQCVTFHGITESDEVFRPSGRDNPVLSWAYRLAGPWVGKGGITTSFRHDEGAMAIEVTPEFSKKFPEGFAHIFQFAVRNHLKITVNEGKCSMCEGRGGCKARASK